MSNNFTFVSLNKQSFVTITFSKSIIDEKSSKMLILNQQFLL